MRTVQTPLLLSEPVAVSDGEACEGGRILAIILKSEFTLVVVPRFIMHVRLSKSQGQGGRPPNPDFYRSNPDCTHNIFCSLQGVQPRASLETPGWDLIQES